MIEGMADPSFNVDWEPGSKGKFARQTEKIYVNSKQQTTHHPVIFSSRGIALLYWCGIALGHIADRGRAR
jgi:hypothetical protein